MLLPYNMDFKQIIAASLAILSLSFIFPKNSFAHPGNTASDGCHYCRTRCDYWGVPWNTRHCHRGSAYSPPAYSIVTSTPRPIARQKPTSTPYPSANSTSKLTEQSISSTVYTPTLEPLITPQLMGTSDENLVTGGMAVTGGTIALLYLLGRKLFKKKNQHIDIQESTK
jgi:hypothetical protein